MRPHNPKPPVLAPQAPIEARGAFIKFTLPIGPRERLFTRGALVDVLAQVRRHQTMCHDRSQAIMYNNVRAGRLRATLGGSLFRWWFSTGYSHRKKSHCYRNGDQKYLLHRQLPLFLNPTVAKAALSICTNTSSTICIRHNRRKQWPTYTDSVKRTIQRPKADATCQPMQTYHAIGQVALQSGRVRP